MPAKDRSDSESRDHLDVGDVVYEISAAGIDGTIVDHQGIPGEWVVLDEIKSDADHKGRMFRPASS